MVKESGKLRSLAITVGSKNRYCPSEATRLASVLLVLLTAAKGMADKLSGGDPGWWEGFIRRRRITEQFHRTIENHKVANVLPMPVALDDSS